MLPTSHLNAKLEGNWSGWGTEPKAPTGAGTQKMGGPLRATEESSKAAQLAATQPMAGRAVM